MTTSWHLGRLAAFDTETTGTDPETARIVAAALVLVGGGELTDTREWLTDAGGEDIPDGAAAVHGITTDLARAEGRPLANVVREIVAALVEQIRAGVPLVVMNARYDFTLLDREMQRLNMPPLTELAGRPLLVLDPLVLDRQADQYRPGKRTLEALCEHYRVRLDGAHDATADAVAAARVVYRIAQLSPNARSHSLENLHDFQVNWAAEQAESLEKHLREKNPAAMVERAWPLVPRQRGAR